MASDCSQTVLGFQALDSRRVVADFDGGMVTSDAGALLLREADLLTRLPAHPINQLDELLPDRWKPKVN